MGKSVEEIKAESRHLRGHVYEDMFASVDPGVSEESRQIMKFFGLYMQDNRDERKQRKAEGLDLHYSFMVRIALAGGRLTAEQYLAIDALADEIGLGHFRLTSRQAIQMHGIAKPGVHRIISRLHQLGATTLAGCGDVERNVMTCPVPDGGLRDEVAAVADRLARHLKPKTGAYLELFVNGQKVYDMQEDEPLYGDTYLPRKFKTGFAVEGDNCTDIYSDDLGIVAHPDADGRLALFSILVGGGLGHSHGLPNTKAFLAKPLGRVKPEDLTAVVEAVVTTQRDHGNRENRKYARMKYLVEEWGVDAFRAEVERRSGVHLLPAEPIHFGPPQDHLGWHPGENGVGHLGLFIPAGRVQGPVREALHTILSELGPNLRVTAQQNLLLIGLSAEEARRAEQIWTQHGLALAEAMHPVSRISMACVALPTCGLALAEAERVFPAVLKQVDELWAQLGLAEEPLVVRMTGCPNNCVRSEMAEIGVVGASPGKYHIYLGGSPKGTRLAQKIFDRIPFDDLVPTISPLLRWYAEERRAGMAFGDWVADQGIDRLQARIQEVLS
ncbi:NADPH-dependent assimilatory sulfite reductase hemoprotein subunit [Sulfobacillus harzensis]|uniref:NADPH-dependent assimilatory sulfite reductase hemoprotein subunit n=1 Tax=Sulfobacillus harzensis TaxID=2729629 RepID=A0A7Y0Q4D2_9FIRM|nr:NADPH-dependent assimilatory sulfite reductase hemoprotein subunit [Sulfobacillus harzensis]NMP23881.1 NADPH-dependent assimilatory sulfite reductase hemoprotein subunit [Sulfobacillus harzensis]